MPPTTAYSFGEVILVPFPFTDQTGLKKRPAVIVSSAEYNAQRRDVVIMAITSQVRTRPAFGEFTGTARIRPVSGDRVFVLADGNLFDASTSQG